jgi:ribose transport system substrate-binding protein
MLPAETEVEGADCPYCPMGAPRISYASPPYSGGLALKLAVDILEGKEVEKTTILPLPLVTNDTIQLCETGSWQEMNNGCNAFPPSFIPNPGWFASIFSPETPELGMEAALVGQPELE